MMKYELTTEVKESYWTTYYYEVEANSLFDAIEKVKNEEALPYDRYLDYCGEMIPEYSPTKSIYDSKGNVVWINKIPYCENWTKSLKLTRHSVKQLLKTNFTSITGKLSWATFREIANELGWIANMDYETNGYQIDYWETFTDPNGEKYKVNGCMWTDEFSIEKIK